MSPHSNNDFPLYDGNIATVHYNGQATTVSCSDPNAGSTGGLLGHLIMQANRHGWGDFTTLEGEFSLAGNHQNQIAEIVKSFRLTHMGEGEGKELIQPEEGQGPQSTANSWLARVFSSIRRPNDTSGRAL